MVSELIESQEANAEYAKKYSFFTDRFFIRPIQELDRALYPKLYCDPKIMRYIAEPFSVEQADALFQSVVDDQNRLEPVRMAWVILSRIDNAPLGILGLKWNTKDRTEAEIGIMLFRLANGKLIPEEAIRGLIELSFKKMSLDKITGRFLSSYVAPKRYMKKLGFLFAESKDESISITDSQGYVGSVTMGYIDRSWWLYDKAI